MASVPKRAWRKYRQEGPIQLLKSSARYLKESGPARQFRARCLPETQELRGITLDLKEIDVSTKIRLEISSGDYESEEANAIDNHIGHNTSVIDLGACLGFTAAYTNHVIDDSKNHIVVEPNEKLIPVLRRTRELNNCDFEIINAAYASNNESVRLTVPEDVWGGSLHRDSNTQQIVDGVNLGKIVDEYNLSEFILVADIEGAEIDLIKNELDLLEQHCSKIIMEFHDNKDEYSNISDQVVDVKQLLGDSTFEKVEQRSDVAVYTNASFNSVFK